MPRGSAPRRVRGGLRGGADPLAGAGPGPVQPRARASGEGHRPGAGPSIPAREATRRALLFPLRSRQTQVGSRGRDRRRPGPAHGAPRSLSRFHDACAGFLRELCSSNDGAPDPRVHRVSPSAGHVPAGAGTQPDPAMLAQASRLRAGGQLPVPRQAPHRAVLSDGSVGPSSSTASPVPPSWARLRSRAS